MKAVFNNETIAESDSTVVVEGNHYFPAESINRELLAASELKTTCHWKGEASYFSVEVDGEEAKDAAWTYVEPSEAASNIKNYFAFWNGVEVVE